MKYAKLLGISVAVASIGSYVFNFDSFNSKDSLIRQGVDKLKSAITTYKASLAELQEDYRELMANLESTQDALQIARTKLQEVYEKATGKEWNEEDGDILEYDFGKLINSEVYENNADGDAIAELLKLQKGASTEEILEAIQDLIDTVQTLESRITVLENQVEDLQGQISTYEDEQTSLVEEINNLKDKLDQATAEANAIINGASNEEQAQLDYINGTLTELGLEPVVEDENESPVEDETPKGDDENEPPVGGDDDEEENEELKTAKETFANAYNENSFFKNAREDGITVEDFINGTYTMNQIMIGSNPSDIEILDSNGEQVIKAMKSDSTVAVYNYYKAMMELINQQ